MTKIRNHKLDNIKCFLICCVVFGHLGNYYAASSLTVGATQFWVYLFHMPAFIFISGLFSKKTVDDKNWGKIVPYLLIYLFMEFIQYVVRCLCGSSDNVLDVLRETNVPWYALAMFWWLLAAIAVRRVKPGYVLAVSIVLALLSGYSATVGPFLVLQRTIIFFPFFYTGYIINPNHLLKRLNRVPVKTISGVILIVSMVIAIVFYRELAPLRLLFRARASYSEMFDGFAYAFAWFWRGVAYIISALLTLSVIAVMPDVSCRLTSHIGKNTLPVFVFHWSMYTLMLQLIPGFAKYIKNHCTPMLCLAFCIFIVLVLSTPIFSWPLKKIMTVPKREEET